MVCSWGDRRGQRSRRQCDPVLHHSAIPIMISHPITGLPLSLSIMSDVGDDMQVITTQVHRRTRGILKNCENLSPGLDATQHWAMNSKQSGTGLESDTWIEATSNPVGSLANHNCIR